MPFTAVLTGPERTTTETPRRPRPAPFPAFAGSNPPRSGFGSRVHRAGISALDSDLQAKGASFPQISRSSQGRRWKPHKTIRIRQRPQHQLACRQRGGTRSVGPVAFPLLERDGLDLVASPWPWTPPPPPRVSAAWDAGMGRAHAAGRLLRGHRHWRGIGLAAAGADQPHRGGPGGGHAGRTRCLGCART